MNLSEEEKLRRKTKRETTLLQCYNCRHNWASKDDTINGRGTIKQIYGGIGAGSNIIKQKIANTKLKKYNNEHWCNPQKCSETYKNSSEEYKKKILDTRKRGIINKYGVSSFSKTEEYQNLYKDKEWENHRIKAIYLTKRKTVLSTHRLQNFKF